MGRGIGRLRCLEPRILGLWVGLRVGVGVEVEEVEEEGSMMGSSTLMDRLCLDLGGLWNLRDLWDRVWDRGPLGYLELVRIW